MTGDPRTAWPPGQPLFLRPPPFPGSRPAAPLSLETPGAGHVGDLHQLAQSLRVARVGGHYWGRLPRPCWAGHVLICPSTPVMARAMEAALEPDQPAIFWQAQGQATSMGLDAGRKTAPDEAVPNDTACWPLLAQAAALWCDRQDPHALVAALLDRPIRCWSDGQEVHAPTLPQLLDEQILAPAWHDPFTGARCPPDALIAIHAQWRILIEANRSIAVAVGFGGWKRPTVAPLLWAGTGAVPFRKARISEIDTLAALAQPAVPPGHQRLEDTHHAPNALAIWKARVPRPFLAAAEQAGVPLIEVEDGFIRSSGLGADCVPPLSILVDAQGAYYDPSGPSDLEDLIEQGIFSADLIARARALRTQLVSTGLGKYGHSTARVARPGGARPHILVPGQVEDDRSVLAGGGYVRSNLALLKAVRAANPDAFIVFKPHPDIEAGHRRGRVPAEALNALADAVMPDAPIAGLIAMADAVHVLTSLAGFEALVQGKPVTTYGQPFYSGWGLTIDRAPPTGRRHRRASLDELVAATLILYPRSIDPITGLPCAPEILIDRLTKGDLPTQGGTLVTLRRLQGRIRRLLLNLLALFR